MAPLASGLNDNPYKSPSDEPIKVKMAPKSVSVAVVGVMLGLMYLIGAPIVMRVSIRWPAPYWFAIGLNAVGISLLIRAKWRCVLLAGVVAIASSVGMWYAEVGAYHVSGLKWAYSMPWYYLLKVPSYLLLGSLFFVAKGENHIGHVRAAFASAVYLASYLMAMLPAPLVCCVALRRSGTFPHGNYDDFGYRLGVYALVASFLCVLLARQICLGNIRRPVDTTGEPTNSHAPS